MAYESVEDRYVCTLNDKPIGEIEVCNKDELLFKAEELVIEEGRRQNE